MDHDALTYLDVTDAVARARTTIAAATDVAATSAGDNVTDVRWTDHSDNETGFKVERGPSTAGPWTILGTTLANAGLWVDDQRAALIIQISALPLCVGLTSRDRWRRGSAGLGRCSLPRGRPPGRGVPDALG